MMSKLSLLVLLLAGLAAGNATADDRPNVILLVIDDLRPAVGAYGDRLAHTPHLDALAKRGALFTRAFATVPVCGASRASMLSGLLPTPQRFVSYRARLDEDAPEALGLPAALAAAGYQTRAFGKVFDVTADSAGGWSKPVWNPPFRWHSPVKDDGRATPLQKAYLRPLTDTLGPAWESLEVDDGAYPDGQVTDAAIDAIRSLRTADSPTFIAVGLRKPHLPFTSPARYLTPFNDTDMTPPTWQRSGPPQAYHGSPELRRQYAGFSLDRPVSETEARQLRQHYYAAVHYVDAQAGRIWQTLVDEGLDANTVFIVTSDHGFLLGEHDLWTKHSLFDLALRVPLLITGAGFDAGRQVDLPVSLVDVYPTILRAAHVSGATRRTPGEALQDYQGPVSKAQRTRHVYSRWLDADSVYALGYRYTIWRDASGVITARMLYDHRTDPHEQRNLMPAREKRHLAVADALEARLLEHATLSPDETLVLGARRFRALE